MERHKACKVKLNAYNHAIRMDYSYGLRIDPRAGVLAKILVIDDDRDILDFIRVGLNDEHEVTTAENGEVALRACEKITFDLVLTDIFMPFRDGLDIVREVTSLYPASKIIAMTSHFGEGQTDYLKAAQAFGAHETLKKPFTIDGLMTVVESALNA